jgi:uncharacterized protein (DUF697 family)
MEEKKEASFESKEIAKEETDKIIRNHMYSAFGLGLIPLPLVDLAAITAVQLNLIRKLAKLYDIPFSKDKVKNILTSLIGGTVPAATGMPLASLAKAVPIVGYSIGAISTSVIASASTYAVGHVFNRHFASGGTFLTFDTEKVKYYYGTMFKKGKETASDIKKDSDSDSSVNSDSDDKAEDKSTTSWS